MAFNLRIDEDFMNVCNDFMETCTLKVSGEVDQQLYQCVVSEPIEWRELDPTNAQVLRQGTLFVWPKSKTDRPPLGSVVVDSDGTYWTVWRVTNKQHVETWEAKCLNLGIVTADANTATILKATYTHGRAGEAKATWVGLWSEETGGAAEDTVAARFQPSDETAQVQFGAEWSKETYRVYFEEPVPLEAAGGEYRFVDSEGYRYRVVRYYDEQRIDKLPVAIAVRITEGSEFWDGPGASEG